MRALNMISPPGPRILFQLKYNSVNFEFYSNHRLNLLHDLSVKRLFAKFSFFSLILVYKAVYSSMTPSSDSLLPSKFNSYSIFVFSCKNLDSILLPGFPNWFLDRFMMFVREEREPRIDFAPTDVNLFELISIA